MPYVGMIRKLLWIGLVDMIILTSRQNGNISEHLFQSLTKEKEMDKRANILFITVDDMNYDSIGCNGCSVANISPNIDCLAAEGVRFENSHVTIAVCQPSRSVLMTGRYPYHNGARGFEEIDAGTPTVTEYSHAAGYYNGIIGKENHLAPKEKFAWDEYISVMDEENGYGRSPEVYYKKCKDFINNAKALNKPFFLMFNVHDPHRPFAGSIDEKEKFGKALPVSKRYDENEISVPGFLFDLPEIRTEMAQYYTSVHRADESVGSALQALKESGLENDTLVFFCSDNGMSAPFSKTNCYLNSTKSPFIIRWPGYLQPGTVCRYLASGIDVAPTFLDAMGISPMLDADGQSLISLIRGTRRPPESIYTQFFKTQNNKITKKFRSYPMRCVQTERYCYIFNAWADGETLFKSESMSGLTFQAMEKASERNPDIAKRVEFLKYRVKEELYDTVADSNALNNLADNPKYACLLDDMRKKLFCYMVETHDSLVDDIYFRTLINKMEEK